MENKYPLPPTKENILKLTKNGLLIFLFFIKTLRIKGTRAVNIKNPFYDDRKASFSISQNDSNGRWGFFDYGDRSYKGDCFDFAILYYKAKNNLELNFAELLPKIYFDLDLKSKTEEDAIEINNISYESKELTTKKEKLFEVYPREFDSKDLEFCAQYRISKETLKMCNVVAVLSYRYYDDEKNKWNEFRCYNITFAYQGKGYAKIYQPNPKNFFWLGNKPSDYIFGFDLLPDWGGGELVILTGGEKDALTLIELGYFAISLSSEIVNPPKDLDMQMVGIGLTLVVLYDIDATGLERGRELSKILKCRNVVLPDILKDHNGKDVSDWIKCGLPLDDLKNLIDSEEEGIIVNSTEALKLDSPVINLIENEEEISDQINVEVKETQLVNDQDQSVVQIELNPFPYDAFPLEIQKIILATHAALKFPVDFISASILFAGSLAIGNTHKIEIKKGWRESAVLYMALVGRPGTNKSHPVTFAIDPISNADKKSYNEFLSDKEEFEKAIKLSKKEREEQSIEEPKKPFWKKFILSDYTPEALAEVHFHNKRGIGVYADEFAGWIKNFNRYNKGSEMEFWLSSWSGKPINSDRKSGEKIFIPYPFISVFGTIQNGLLIDLSKDNKTKNGFMDRLLFVCPDNIKKPYWSELELDESVNETWNSIIGKLLELDLKLDDIGNPISEILNFCPEAKSILFEWQRDNADLCNNTENESVSGIYSKFDIYALRLALILEMLRWSCNEGEKKFISVEAIRGSLKLVEYFKNMAVKVNSIISSDSPLDRLTSDKQKIYDELPNTFTTGLGVDIAKVLGMPEKTFKTFLNQKDLFKRIKHGEYEKLI